VKLSVVIPIFNEGENLPELYQRLQVVFNTLSEIQHEIVYVNDNSDDSSLEIMLQQRRIDSRVTVIHLSRNFGHQAAITAGLTAAEEGNADAVVIMDGDLQDPPEVIVDLVRSWQQGAEVVCAQRRTRQERGIRRLLFNLFHKLLGWVSDFPIPAQVGVFGLLNRQALSHLNALPERHRFLPGLRAWIGFDQRTVMYDRHRRAQGEPKQSFRRLVQYALDGLLGFSYKPLRLMVVAGGAISSMGFILAMVFIIKRLAGTESAQTGFTTLVTLVLFLGGVQLIAVGLLGEYLGRVYDEVKQRPLYIVRNRFSGPTNEGDSLTDLSPKSAEK
jgi:dolichol-phosphate mannosyltransferase